MRRATVRHHPRGGDSSAERFPGRPHALPKREDHSDTCRQLLGVGIEQIIRERRLKVLLPTLPKRRLDGRHVLAALALLESIQNGLHLLVGCLYSIGDGLGGDRVLVDEAAEPVVPADRGGSRGLAGSCRLIRFGRRESERTVRPMAVVVVDELSEHVL